MMAGDRVRMRVPVLPRKPAEEHSMETRQFSPDTTRIHSLLSLPKCLRGTQKKGIKEILKNMHAPKKARDSFKPESPKSLQALQELVLGFTYFCVLRS